MSSDDTVIVAERNEGDEDGNGYSPEISMQYDEARRELYVIVGEEVGSMCEGVPVSAWAKIRERMSR